MLNEARDILFEDTRFVFLHKPAGMAVHGVVGTSLGVIESLRAMRPKAPYLELAHRLDKATSGCLVIAKRKSALRAFQKLQASRGVDKHYLALVKGVWQQGHGKVAAPLYKSVAADGKWTVCVDQHQGKRAISYFFPVDTYADTTLMRIKIITGRTHQIRVHAAHIGFPIVGDDKYGDGAFQPAMWEKNCSRLCLHAASIAFTLPGIARYAVVADLAESKPHVWQS